MRDLTSPQAQLTSAIPQIASVGRVAVIADMTGTLLRQTEGGFTREAQREISAIIENPNADFVLVTADAPHKVMHHFYSPLASGEHRPRSGNLFMLTLCGQVITKVSFDNEAEQIKQIYEGPFITLEDRKAIFASALSALNVATNNGVEQIPESHQSLLFDASGHRLALDNYYAGFGPGAGLEITPGKGALFFLDADEVVGTEKNALDIFQAEVERGFKDSSYKIIRGANYVDVVSMDKCDGLTKLFSLDDPDVTHIQDAGRLEMGDSFNDLGIFAAPSGNGKRIRLFLGDDDTIPHMVSNLSTIPDNADIQTIHHKGSFVDGGTFALSELNRMLRG